METGNIQKRVRGFEHTTNSNVELPVRSTKYSAGYDFYIKEDIEIKPSLIINEEFSSGKKVVESSLHKPTIIPTGVKVYMLEEEVLKLYLRSSLGKLGLHIPNSVGIIDSDYYNNSKNEGQIFFMVLNFSNDTISLKKGDRIGQGIFQKFLVADNGNSENKRIGGIGSTN